jgi:periplasmic protein TonB
MDRKVANGFAPVGQHPYAPWLAAVTAVGVHLLLALGLASLPKVGLHGDRAIPVEVDLVTPPPPQAAPPPPIPSPDPPPPDPTPKLAVRRPALHKAPPPMPNQEETKPPPADTPPTPVFGVTADSVVQGESSVAVPLGNTLMTKDRTLAKAPPPPLPAAPPPPAAPAFAPVDEESVAELPDKLFMPEPKYPDMALRLGVEGKVRLRLGIDRRGNVKSVRVLQKVGFGMDEAAEAAAWKSNWKPAKKETGEAVDVVIHYNFIFQLPTR